MIPTEQRKEALQTSAKSTSKLNSINELSKGRFHHKKVSLLKGLISWVLIYIKRNCNRTRHILPILIQLTCGFLRIQRQQLFNPIDISNRHIEAHYPTVSNIECRDSDQPDRVEQQLNFFQQEFYMLYGHEMGENQHLEDQCLDFLGRLFQQSCDIFIAQQEQSARRSLTVSLRTLRRIQTGPYQLILEADPQM